MKKIIQSVVITLLVAMLLSCAVVDVCIIANIWNAQPLNAIAIFSAASITGAIVYYAIRIAIRRTRFDS